VGSARPSARGGRKGKWESEKGDQLQLTQREEKKKPDPSPVRGGKKCPGKNGRAYSHFWEKGKKKNRGPWPDSPCIRKGRGRGSNYQKGRTRVFKKSASSSGGEEKEGREQAGPGGAKEADQVDERRRREKISTPALKKGKEGKGVAAKEKMKEAELACESAPKKGGEKGRGWGRKMDARQILRKRKEKEGKNITKKKKDSGLFLPFRERGGEEGNFL